MRYVDGFLLVIPKKNMKEYKKMAALGGKVWMKHGALQYMETVIDDAKTGVEMGCRPFAEAADAKKDEVVVFSYIVFKSRKHRDAVNAKVMKDPSMSPDAMNDKAMPFDIKRMCYGGFETFVDR